MSVINHRLDVIYRLLLVLIINVISSIAYADTVVMAINIGGQAYQDIDGVNYQADELTSTPAKSIKSIRGVQDQHIFKSYKEGNLEFDIPIKNGEYQIMFRFVEPEDIAIGERIFDVIAENKIVIADLDIRLARDGKHLSALDRSVYKVIVSDQQLNIKLQAKQGKALLSALIIRQKNIATNQWQLIWQDEFNLDGSPDPKKWNIDLWPAAKVNDEDQIYTDHPQNLFVADGLLNIVAHKQGQQYTSARIHSKGKGDLLYGRVDVRAKLPAGQGSWPAIWMLPSNPYQYASDCDKTQDWQGNPNCDAWPNSGEIDIMEHVGYDMHTVHGTVHNKAFYWKNWQQRKGSIEAQNVDRAFHLYSLIWTPTTITMLFDHIPYFTYQNPQTGWQAWPFDHPYHLILNLAVGGMWGRAGGPIDDSIFPIAMQIDYVRFYQAITSHNENNIN